MSVAAVIIGAEKTIIAHVFVVIYVHTGVGIFAARVGRTGVTIATGTRSSNALTTATVIFNSTKEVI